MSNLARTLINQVVRSAVYLVAASGLLIGCFDDEQRAFLNARETKAPGRVAAEYDGFAGPTRSEIELGAGRTLVVTYDLEVEDGELALSLYAPWRLPIWQRTFKASGRGRFEVPIQVGGTYVLEVRGADTRGKYDVRWRIEQR